MSKENIKETETILVTESKPEAIEVVDFIHELSQSEQKEFSIFLQGIRFGETLKQNV